MKPTVIRLRDEIESTEVGKKTCEPTERVIFVTVSGGVAYVCEDTLPPGVRVEVIDFDNLADSPREIDRLSPAAQAYVAAHFT